MRLRILGFGVVASAILMPMTAGCGSDDPAEPIAAPPSPTITVAPAPTSSPTPAAALPTVDMYADVPLIDHTEWIDDADGRRLYVYPTAAGRADTFPAALDRAWGEVVAASPDADSPGMYDQFRCHWEWARLVKPNKPSWNLEPWRPAVGYEATVQALCNPGGPDPAGG
ncbi:DUF2599 domain-containing protein [Nocardia sp. NPDC004068]|uniref:DUF2599 domain-containing protein n=1 Tax=Nocardia sp. NPDC004068 TaxID=3364303 RepID=UPI0036800070